MDNGYSGTRRPPHRSSTNKLCTASVRKSTWRFGESDRVCYRSAITPGPTTPNHGRLGSLQILFRRRSWLLLVVLGWVLKRICNRQVAGSIPSDWCQIGAKPRRTRRTQRTSLKSHSPISSREDRRRYAEFVPVRNYGSEGLRQLEPGGRGARIVHRFDSRLTRRCFGLDYFLRWTHARAVKRFVASVTLGLVAASCDCPEAMLRLPFAHCKGKKSLSAVDFAYREREHLVPRSGYHESCRLLRLFAASQATSK